MNKPYKKMFSPFILDLVNRRLVASSDSGKDLDLNIGFINDHKNKNYGFVVIAKKDGKVFYEQYSTEERIAAAGIEGDYLLVYEDGKTSPWGFRLDGSLVEEASFQSQFTSDCEYYEEHYGSSLVKGRNL